jgi:anaerobic selenocysteine-containing dehydrogenase
VFETPGGGRFVTAMQRVPFVVSFASFLDESAEQADLVLPEPTFLQRYEDHFIEGLGYPGVGLRQPVVPTMHHTMSVGDFLLRVAREIGGPVAEAFPWQSYQGVLRYRLDGEAAKWDQLSELGVWMTPGYHFARRGSTKWVEEVVGRDRRLAPRDGHFDFFSRELSCIVAAMSDEQRISAGLADGIEPGLPHYVVTPYAGDAGEYPFLLNVITLMSLGPVSAAANLPTLQEISGMTVGETWGSWLEMNPESAEKRHLADGDDVWIESPFGRLQTRLRLVAALRPDVVNLPYNQGHTAVGRWAKDRGVNGMALLNPASEPATGLASLTNTRVKVYRA